LRYFVAVARERNFTRATETLRIAQPPLSRQLQQLERELGTLLIERRSRPLRLTAATELTLLEMTTLEQMAALKEGRIDVGFGRIPLDDPRIARTLLRNERLCAALPASHGLLQQTRPLRLPDLACEPLVVYPKAPRPSYADQVLALYRDRGLRPPLVLEVRELQTALGLVAAESGVCLVPALVERLRRDNVVYRALDEEFAVSPILMSTRKDGASPDIALVLELVHAIYPNEGVAFGR